MQRIHSGTNQTNPEKADKTGQLKSAWKEKHHYILMFPASGCNAEPAEFGHWLYLTRNY